MRVEDLSIWRPVPEYDLIVTNRIQAISYNKAWKAFIECEIVIVDTMSKPVEVIHYSH